jgi:hypothetical protein
MTLSAEYPNRRHAVDFKRRRPFLISQYFQCRFHQNRRGRAPGWFGLVGLVDIGRLRPVAAEFKFINISNVIFVESDVYAVCNL